MTRFFLVAFVFLLASLSTSVVADEAKPSEDDEGGAVLCQWALAITLRATMTTCYKHPDRNYLAAFDWAIDEMDAFILRNSPLSRDEVEQKKQELVSQTVKQLKNTDQCAETRRNGSSFPTSELMSVKDYRKGIKRMLAVDRPPVWNPCF